MSRRLSTDSAKSSSSNLSRRSGKISKIENNCDFNWDKYLQHTGMFEAPAHCFKQQVFECTDSNKFQLSDKLEAKDARNPSAISVATVVQIQGPRLCLRLDGTDGCNDFWRLIDSKDIFPLGTCEAHGGLLQPPLGYTRNVSTWPGFLRKILSNANHASSDCFYQEPDSPLANLFEVGMKLEAVDKKNPHLICPATIGDVDQDQVFVSFDGWRGAFDYWCNYASRDLFPVDWCLKNNHFLQVPGKKGDNPIVVEKLRLIADQRKRQTRSVKNNLEHKQPTKDLPPVQIKEKPVRRRRVDSIKAITPEDVKEEEISDTDDPPNPNSPLLSDGFASSDESDSSQETYPEKRQKILTTIVSSEDGSTTSSSQSSSSQGHNSSAQSQYSDQELKKLDRKERKQKRKLARMLKRAGIAQEQIDDMRNNGVAVSLNLTPEQVALLTSPRKRLYESEFVKSKSKKKKKKRRLIETSYTRMEGFGLKGGEQSNSGCIADKIARYSFTFSYGGNAADLVAYL